VGDLQAWAKTNGMQWNSDTYAKAYNALTNTPTQTPVINQQGYPNTNPDGSPTFGGTNIQGQTAKPQITDVDIDNVLKNYPSLDAAQRELLKSFASIYQGGTTDFAEILLALKRVSDTTIDPYIANLSDKARQDVMATKAQQDQARQLELESESETAKQNIENTQANLEASGMTFSGAAIKQLGNQAAQQNTYGIEGLVPKANRLMSTGSQARYDANVRNLARNYEDAYGSAAAGQLFGATNIAGGTTEAMSTAGQQKEQLKGSVLNSLLNQYQQKNTLLTNQ
jgi:hypothetical protein